jgi:hypothetical protein
MWRKQSKNGSKLVKKRNNLNPEQNESLPHPLAASGFRFPFAIRNETTGHLRPDLTGGDFRWTRNIRNLWETTIAGKAWRQCY